MKTLPLYLLIYLLLASLTSSAQPNIQKSLYIQEKHCYAQLKRYWDMRAHPNGSVFGVCSVDGSSAGQHDAMLTKFNAQFDTVWHKKYGGSGEDKILYIDILPNQNLLLTGTTNSHDGDVPYGQAISASDIWLLEVDTNGVIQKGRTIKGYNGSGVSGVVISSDNYIYLCGSTSSDQFDFTHVGYGWPDKDGWYAKLDTTFTLRWIKFLVSNTSDEPTMIAEVNPTRFIIGTSTSSTDSNLNGWEDRGYGDMVFDYIDSSGNIYWQKRFGGSYVDLLKKCIVDPVSREIYASGRSGSLDGDITYRTEPTVHEYLNWVVKLDTMGNLLASKAYGAKYSYNPIVVNGTDMWDAIWHNNQLWTVCTTNSEGGDVDASTKLGIGNGWIGVYDNQANLVNKYTVNGFGVEHVESAFEKDGDIWFSGYSSAHPHTNTFSCDTVSIFDFVFNLKEAPLRLNRIEHDWVFKVFPNPSQQAFVVNWEPRGATEKITLRVWDTQGKKYWQQLAHQTHSVTIPCKTWPSGNYFIQLTNEQGQSSTQQISKQ